VTVPAAAAANSGDVVIVGSIVGIAAGDAAIGADLDICVGGIYDLGKVSALAIAIGDKVYFDATAGLVNKTASGNTLLGVAVAAAANPSATARVRLNPAF
jgi:predicted RecA/RadA family phage recombinase